MLEPGDEIAKNGSKIRPYKKLLCELNAREDMEGAVKTSRNNGGEDNE